MNISSSKQNPRKTHLILGIFVCLVLFICSGFILYSNYCQLENDVERMTHWADAFVFKTNVKDETFKKTYLDNPGKYRLKKLYVSQCGNRYEARLIGNNTNNPDAVFFSKRMLCGVFLFRKGVNHDEVMSKQLGYPFKIIEQSERHVYICRRRD